MSKIWERTSLFLAVTLAVIGIVAIMIATSGGPSKYEKDCNYNGGKYYVIGHERHCILDGVDLK